MKKQSTKLSGPVLKKIFEITVVLLALIILLPQAIGLLRDRELLASLPIQFILIATAIYALTPIFAAASYIYLSPKPISFLKSIAVQYASGFTNRLLPSGAGALATVTSFLSKSGLSIPEGLSLALINNILGFVAFVIVMVFLKAYNIDNIKTLLPQPSNIIIVLIAVIAIILVSVVMANKRIRNRIAIITNDALHALKQIFYNPLSTVMAILANCGITVLHIICLMLCVIGVGYHLPLEIIALIFTMGIAAIAVSPTPNGLGLSELVLSSALQTFGLPPEQALVAALSYRLVTFWIPILPGYLFYRYSRSKNII